MPPPATVCSHSKDIRTRSPPAPSRPTAHACSPARTTTRCACGMPPPATVCSHSKHIRAGSPPAPSRPTAHACSPARTTARCACGMRSPVNRWAFASNYSPPGPTLPSPPTAQSCCMPASRPGVIWAGWCQTSMVRCRPIRWRCPVPCPEARPRLGGKLSAWIDAPRPQPITRRVQGGGAVHRIVRGAHPVEMLGHQGDRRWPARAACRRDVGKTDG